MPRISFQKTGELFFYARCGRDGCRLSSNFKPLLVPYFLFIIIPFINCIGRSEASRIYSL